MTVSNAIWRTFLNGLAVVLPVVITCAVVYWFGASLERALGGLIRQVIAPERYFQGLGLIAGIALVFVVGIATRIWLTRQIIRLGDRLLQRIPLAKSVYGAVRDLVRFVSRSSQAQTGRTVVLVDVAEHLQLVGFVTQEQGAHGGLGIDNDKVAVYLPMSLQLGGYTVFFPAERVRALDMDFEDAMRWILTAGMSPKASDEA